MHHSGSDRIVGENSIGIPFTWRSFQAVTRRSAALSTWASVTRRLVEHPDDKRNLEAATIFDRLAKSVGGVPRTTLNAFFELYEDYEGDELSEELRQVGFHFDPMTAEDFCRSGLTSAA